MKVHVCNVCGGNLELTKDNCFRCVSCGAISEVPFVEENQMASNIRAKLRMNDFDEAEELALDAATQYPENAEINWLNVLSHYAIKYEKDYDGKEIPTCYALSYDSFLEDPHYLKAIQYGDKDQKAYYQKQAAIIEKIRTDWMEIVKSEPPYDIFISYKDKNVDGRTKTEDFMIALQLYTHWKDLGYKVFFAHETLKGKLGEEYEPYIFNAINTSYCMVLIGTSVENINSTWVKNEWTRYLKAIEKGKKAKNSLVVAYKDFNASNLPRQLANIQALDINSVTFSSDLDNHLAKLKKSNSKVKTIDKVVLNTKMGKKATTISENAIHDTIIAGSGNSDYSPDDEKKLQIASNYFTYGLKDEANALLDSVLESNPNYGEANLTRFLFDNGVGSIDDLDHVSEIENINGLDKLVTGLGEEKAYKLLDKLYDNATSKIREGKPAKNILDAIIMYSYPNRKNKLDGLFSLVSTKLDREAFETLLKTIDNNDVDYYIEKCLNFADKLLCSGNIKDADIMYKKIVSLDNGNVCALRGILKCACTSLNGSNLVQYNCSFSNFEQYDLLENLLKFLKEEDQAKEIDAILKAASASCKPEFLYRLLQYYPYELSNVSSYVLDRADKILQSRDFESALYYYNLLKEYNIITSRVLMGIILCKCECSKVELLNYAKTPINSLPEYGMYLSICNDEERKQCIEILANQKKYNNMITLIDDEEIQMRPVIVDYFKTLNQISYVNKKVTPIKQNDGKLSKAVFGVGLVSAIILLVLSAVCASTKTSAGIVFHYIALAYLAAVIVIKVIASKKKNKTNINSKVNVEDLRRKLTSYEKRNSYFRLNHKTEFIGNTAYNLYRDYNCHYMVLIDSKDKHLTIVDYLNNEYHFDLNKVTDLKFTIDARPAQINSVKLTVVEDKTKDIYLIGNTVSNTTRKLEKIEELKKTLSKYLNK